jgi:hypothetical protein
VDAKPARLRGGLVVPDDADALLRPCGPEGPGCIGALELRAAARPIGALALGNRDLVERLAVAERDLSKCAAEVAVELERDQLVDVQGAVTSDLDDDLGRRQRERLRGGVSGEREGSQNDNR